MAEQTLKIRIIAQNLAKGVLGGLKGALGGAQKNAEGVQRGLGGSILQANLLTAAVTGGVRLAFDTANRAVGTLSRSILGAAELQQQQLSSVGSFAAVVGKEFEDAEKLIGNFEETLAKNVGSLPGATQGYIDLARAISDEVGGAFQRLDGTLNESGFRRALESLSTTGGLLGSSSGISSADTALGIQRALGGASIATLRQLSLFERNPALLRLIEDAVTGAGGKSLADFDSASRVKILEDALNQIVSPELIERSSNSFQGILEGFISTLFDPTTGVFGLLRDLNPNIEGSQNIITRATRTLELLLGPSGLITALGSAASRLLGGQDPLVLLDRGLRAFNSFLEGFTLPSFARFSDFSLSGLFNDAVTGFTAWIDNVDFYAVGQEWGRVVGDLAGRTRRFIANIDWGQVLNFIRSTAGGINDFLIGYFAETTFQFLGLIRDGLASMTAAIARGIRTLFRNISNSLERSIGLSLGDVTQIVAGGLTGGIVGAAGATVATARRQATPRGFAEGGYFGGLSPMMGALAQELIKAPSGANPVIANSSETILTPTQTQSFIQNSAQLGKNHSASPIYITVNANFNRGELNAEFDQFMQMFERALVDRIAGNLA